MKKPWTPHAFRLTCLCQFTVLCSLTFIVFFVCLSENCIFDICDKYSNQLHGFTAASSLFSQGYPLGGHQAILLVWSESSSVLFHLLLRSSFDEIPFCIKNCNILFLKACLGSSGYRTSRYLLRSDHLPFFSTKAESCFVTLFLLSNFIRA